MSWSSWFVVYTLELKWLSLIFISWRIITSIIPTLENTNRLVSLIWSMFRRHVNIVRVCSTGISVILTWTMSPNSKNSERNARVTRQLFESHCHNTGHLVVYSGSNQVREPIILNHWRPALPRAAPFPHHAPLPSLALSAWSAVQAPRRQRGGGGTPNVPQLVAVSCDLSTMWYTPCGGARRMSSRCPFQGGTVAGKTATQGWCRADQAE